MPAPTGHKSQSESSVKIQTQQISCCSDPCVFLFLSSSRLQLNTLRGSILEDAVPSTSKHGLARGLPLKEVLEYLVPELNVHCLRLALNTPKVTEQLMKLDEQGVRKHNEEHELF